MKVYIYDEITKEYLKEEIAMLDPLESKLQNKEIYLLPANATFIKPKNKEGFANVFNGNAWELVEDNRGKVYYLPSDDYTSDGQEMKELGALPVGASLEKPQKSLEVLKSEKIAEIERAKNIANESDIEFNSKMFGAKTKDQQLLTQTITLYQLSGGLPSGFGWISAGNEIVPFSDISDLITLGALIGARTNEIFIKARNLKDEVLKAKSKSALDKIKVEF